MRVPRAFWLHAAACALLLGAAPAQCAPSWVTTALAGTNGTVNAVTWWDSDGLGPRQPVLALGGSFSAAGNVAANRIAWFDPSTQTWGTFGGGLSSTPRALLAMPNGDLVAGGDFNVGNGGPGDHIARWNGSAWLPLASGCNDAVHALTLLPGGGLVAAGAFTQAGGIPVGHVAAWNGAAWTSMGSGAVNLGGPLPPINCLATMPNGDVVAGGRFNSISGVAANCVARWNGATWSPLASGVNPTLGFLVNPIDALLPMPNGDLIVGGQFSSIGGTNANNAARWNGLQWSALGSGPASFVVDLDTTPSGLVVAATLTGGPSFWNGASWIATSGLGSGVLDVAVDPVSGTAAAGGTFGSPSSNLALLSGTTWNAPGGASPNGVFVGGILCSTDMPNGDLLVGGSFVSVDGVLASALATFDGVSWSSTGALSGSFPAAAQVNALRTKANGQVFVGGLFGGAFNINGTSGLAVLENGVWSSVGGGVSNGQFPPFVKGFGSTANGHTIVCGQFARAGGLVVNNVARWTSSAWQSLGSGTNGAVNCAVEMPNGDIVIGGSFTQAGTTPTSRIARWNGTTWQPLAAGVSGEVLDLVVLRNGDLVAAGNFATAGGTQANFIARWNGSNWQSLAGGMDSGINNLLLLPDGDLLATGPFTVAGGIAAQGIARWTGSAWSAVAGGLTGYIDTLHMRNNGDVVVLGSLGLVGGQPSTQVATLRSSCAATVASIGTGCTGSNGQHTLTALGRPWTGSAFVTQSTSLLPASFAIAVYGLAQSQIPLASLLPYSQPGCSLGATLDILDLRIAVGPISTQSLAIPDDIYFAGLPLYQQVVSVSLDAQGTPVEATSSQVLKLVVGTF